MTSRTPLLGTAALVCLLTVTGCGKDTGGTGTATPGATVGTGPQGATGTPGATATDTSGGTTGRNTTGGTTGTSGGTTGTGTGASGGTTGTEYGLDHRTVTVEPGERFSLTVPSSASLGERWYLAVPGPDTAVLRHRGDRASGSGSDADGASGGTQSFDFAALTKGRTTVRLLHCPLHTCTGPGPDDRSTLAPSPAGTASPSPYPTMTGVPDTHAGAGVYVFTVTVR
ncbi:protease inhibitor I42 family protein [Streptomyces sp. Caat 7-52]|uniref:protease inhibitor I42 family protein n=1 Tax=Streptomyces sp. Caat 7-52 TaxID=2949637 RepID=UPI002034B71E|nr:protease inhibitor I42 family protein [Streptomyces sp. Caat 7-52]